MTALDQLRELYQHRDRRARDARRAGRKVVGYFCDNVPEELILAAGFLPYRLSGDPDAGSDALERYIQPFAAPFSARNRGVGFVDAMLDMLLAGRFDFLDYLVVPHTRKSIQAIYREALLAQQAFPELKLPELYYLDRAYTPFYASEVFNRDELLRFKTQLEAWSGKPIGDDALAEAIQTTNLHRGLLQRVAALRTADPPRLSGVDALQVIATGFFIGPHEHNQLLASLLDELGSDLPDRPRIFVGGSPLDHPRLYALVESCGGVVVAEDHCWGARCGEFALDPGMPPFEALADRYHRKPACSIEFPMHRVVERCVGRACAARVDGAIFYVFEGDGVHVWDTPQELAALEREGVPSLYLGQQAYRLDGKNDALREKIAAFIATLRP